MQHPPVSILICGAGSRGRTVYGQFALDHPDLCKVVAVADPRPERREALAREHDIPAEHLFSSWQDIGLGQKIAQVAVVATNDREHVEPALHFLEAGYHLLLEKPMAPDLEGCCRIVEAAEKAQGMSAVCHVLRYTPYFRALRGLIEEGKVGQVVTIRHFEPVNHWHFAHSFVRGNWNNSQTTSPFILAKCCHDMDILLYLMNEEPRALHSFGRLTHFRSSRAPEKAALRCLDCELKEQCTYSATKFYGKMLQEGRHYWPLDVLLDRFEPQALERALRTGPYGRCVYHCDNDVCDHQVVNLEFESGSTASLVATAFTDLPARETEIMGSEGMLRGDGKSILWQDFSSGRESRIEVESSGHHLGGDEAMLTEFFQAVAFQAPEKLSTTPKISLLSHRMALLAEVSRIEGRAIDLAGSESSRSS